MRNSMTVWSCYFCILREIPGSQRMWEKTSHIQAFWGRKVFLNMQIFWEKRTFPIKVFWKRKIYQNQVLRKENFPVPDHAGKNFPESGFYEKKTFQFQISGKELFRIRFSEENFLEPDHAGKSFLESVFRKEFPRIRFSEKNFSESGITEFMVSGRQSVWKGHAGIALDRKSVV